MGILTIMKLIKFFKPTTKFGKVGLTLYLGGAIIYLLYSIFTWDNPNVNFYFGYITSWIIWLIGATGMVMYITYLLKKKKND